MFTVDNIPFPSIVEKLSKDEEINLSDIFKSPDVAYNLDISIKGNKNNLNFGLNKVGQSFYSLANPYLQKNIYEQYVTNRIRLLENRLFLTLKWNKSKNGLFDQFSPLTKKYDMSFSYYPGLDLPSFSFSKSKQYRTSGNQSEGYETTDLDGNTIISGEYDSRIKTITNSYNVSISHNFNLFYKQKIIFNYFVLDKEDKLFDELNNSQIEYISPQSSSDNFSLNIKTNYNYNWESYMQFTQNNFNYAQERHHLFIKNKTISSISTGFTYKTESFLDRLGIRLNLSKGIGNKQNIHSLDYMFFTNFIFKNNMSLNLSYNYKDKDNNNDEDYYNSLFRANLSYSF